VKVSYLSGCIGLALLLAALQANAGYYSSQSSSSRSSSSYNSNYNNDQEDEDDEGYNNYYNNSGEDDDHEGYNNPQQPTPVPEPSALMLLALGISGVGASRLFQRKSK